MHEIWDNWVKFMLAGGFTATGFGALGFNEILGLCGFLVVLATFAVNSWYKRKQFRLDRDHKQKTYDLDRERFEYEKTMKD